MLSKSNGADLPSPHQHVFLYLHSPLYGLLLKTIQTTSYNTLYAQKHSRLSISTPTTTRPSPNSPKSPKPPPSSSSVHHHHHHHMESKKTKWSWTSALIGAATATASAALIWGRPRDPTFHLISIKPKSFKVNLQILNAELILTVHVTNPNIAPIKYSSTSMSIFYQGTLLGTADVQAGSQASMSCELLKLPARLDGLQLAHHASQFLSDVAKREMVLDAAVDIGGTAKVLWWGHKFNVHVDSHIIVDPVFLDVIDQENKSDLDLFVA